MPLHTYLAMTAAEYEKNPEFSASIGWMACHFSPYGTGLSNCPTDLPKGSMLIVNDRTPVCGHDPNLIAQQLKQLVLELECSRVLLDFQRPQEDLTVKIAEAILSAVPCPVGVSECYGAAWDGPIFLPPIPLLQSPASYLSAWHKREIWLEINQQRAHYLLSESGCQQLSFSFPAEAKSHFDRDLCCWYRMWESEDGVHFAIERNLPELKQAAEAFAVDCLIGLYQELGSIDQ